MASRVGTAARDSRSEGNELNTRSVAPSSPPPCFEMPAPVIRMTPSVRAYVTRVLSAVWPHLAGPDDHRARRHYSCCT